MVYFLLRLTFLFFISSTSFKAESQVTGSSRKKTKQEKQHLEIVSKFHSGSGYIKKFIESGLMSEDIEWFVPGPKDILPFAGLWKGADGIEEFNRLLDATMRYDKVEIKEYIVDGDQVAAIFWAEGIAKSTGKTFKSEILRLYTFKEGKIIKVRNFYDTASYVSAVSN
jgi:ketosteroid isomerase-like protein